MPLALRLSEGLGRTRATFRLVDTLYGLRVLGKRGCWPPGATNQLAATVWTDAIQLRICTL